MSINNWFYDRGFPTINCVQTMIDEALKIQNEGKKVYFKGQDWGKSKEGYGLRPTIGREIKYFDQNKKMVFDLESEKNLLHRFRRYAYLDLKRPLGDWEALFLARHYGLPIRLLDWTANPLIALYFAAQCNQNEAIKNDGAVWAIIKKDETQDQKDIDLFSEEGQMCNIKSCGLYYRNKDDLNIKPERNTIRHFDELQKPLRLKGIRILYPFYNSPRMVAQHSFFTIQDDPWTDLNSQEYRIKDENYIDIKEIIRWKVPKCARYPIISQLERLNINKRTIFPDFDGLAKGLCESEFLRHQT